MTITADHSGLNADSISINEVDVTLSNFLDIGGDQYTIDYIITDGDNDISDDSIIPINVVLRSANTITVPFTTSPDANQSPGIDGAIPFVVSALADSNSIVLTMNEVVFDFGAAPSDFTISGVATNPTVDSIEVFEDTITLNLTTLISSNDVITLSYNA